MITYGLLIKCGQHNDTSGCCLKDCERYYASNLVSNSFINHIMEMMVVATAHFPCQLVCTITVTSGVPHEIIVLIEHFIFCLSNIFSNMITYVLSCNRIVTSGLQIRRAKYDYIIVLTRKLQFVILCISKFHSDKFNPIVKYPAISGGLLMQTKIGKLSCILLHDE